MSPDPRRIALIALALVVGVALLAARWMRPEASPPVVASPVLDSADIAVRRMLQYWPHWVTALDDPDLLKQCQAGFPDTWHLVEVPYLPRGSTSVRAGLVTAQGNGARLDYGEQAQYPQVAPTRRVTTLDAAQRATWEAALRSGGYPAALPPLEEFPCMHSNRVAIESCVGGRYYATVRSCTVSPMHELVGRLLDDAAVRTRDDGKSK